MYKLYGITNKGTCELITLALSEEYMDHLIGYLKNKYVGYQVYEVKDNEETLIQDYEFDKPKVRRRW